MDVKENRLIALEERCAYLEDEIDKLSLELSEALDEMQKLRSQFKILYSKVGDPYAVRPLSEEVPPPHY